MENNQKQTSCITLHNRFREGIVCGQETGPQRTKECEGNLANCLGVDVPTLLKMGIIKPYEQGK